MDREKEIEEAYVVNNEQIKEMADFLWKNTIIHTEDLCHDVSETCYNAGYRKQIDVAREIFEDIFHIIRDYEFDALSIENSYGIFQVRNMGAEILRLKKKYMDINQRKEDESNGVHI